MTEADLSTPPRCTQHRGRAANYSLEMEGSAFPKALGGRGFKYKQVIL